jgi:predicted kinase
MGLEEYTLCADTIRMLAESPIMVADKTHRVISQANDNYVWELLYELLEKRMQRGEFVIVDATHSRSSDFSRYNKLCERYRYRKYYVDFSDVPIEICKERNQMREAYKIVPDKAIEKIYARLKTQGKTSGYTEVSKDNFLKEIDVNVFNMDKYERINVFGDIHGCFEPLKKYFEDYPYSENEMYIFTGDYIDRGIQNKEVLEFLIEMSKKPNVLLLEGNHEKWLKYYAFDEAENIKSGTFRKRTMPEILDIDTSELRNLYRRIGQIAYIEYDDNRYLICHGGVPYMPMFPVLIATDQYVNGVGNYNDNIDEIYAKNGMSNVIQIHGHRNSYDMESCYGMSYNLEDKIEFGGNLRVLQLVHGRVPKMIKIKNDVFRIEEEEVEEVKPQVEQKDTDYLFALRNSYDIKETMLGDGISSFNFTRKAFYNKNWNDYTCKARGLFVDTNTGKVVARGYEKFFNVNERRDTELEHLLVKFKDKKITLYKKENGFLGILSYVNGEMFFASKSTNKGDFAEYFKNLFYQSDIDKEKVENYLKENDVTMLFEVIDMVHDPHIIEYDKSKIVLLDIVKNQYEFERLPYEELKEVAEELNAECKTIYKEFDNVREFQRWYIANTDEDDMSKEDIEGVVIECEGILTKLKFPYYNFWKLMRGVKEKVKGRNQIKLSSLYNATSNYFYAWLQKQDNETLEEDIITLRKKFEKENEYGNRK